MNKWMIFKDKWNNSFVVSFRDNTSKPIIEHCKDANMDIPDNIPAWLDSYILTREFFYMLLYTFLDQRSCNLCRGLLSHGKFN